MLVRSFGDIDLAAEMAEVEGAAEAYAAAIRRTGNQRDGGLSRAQLSDAGLTTACSLAASTKSLRDRPPVAWVVSARLT